MAERLRAQRMQLVEQWLDRIARIVALGRREVFPGQDLVDHMPRLIEGVAAYLENAELEINADSPVMAKAIELGVLRYQQGFDAQQILKEYEILGNVLFDFLMQSAGREGASCRPAELITIAHRVFHSVAVIQRNTTAAFLTLDEQRVRDREERLRSFNRLVSHELRNRMGAARAAADLLQEDWASRKAAGRQRYARMVAENLDTIQQLLDNLSRISRAEDRNGDRTVPLPDVVARVTDELEPFTSARGVRVLVDELPRVRVSAAALELALNNLITNAAKYRNTRRLDRWIRLSAELAARAGDGTLTLRVRDNGLGIPEQARAKLFQPYFRAHEDQVDEKGSGLGLSIVRETLERMGGRIWAEFPNEGAEFVLTLPCDSPAGAAQRDVDSRFTSSHSASS
jgi:signal transduction histidine kinase